jgi:hypothetical protein
VDLHQGLEQTGFSLLDDRTLDDLFTRSQLVRLGEAEVRILAPEDHLRLLCLHTLGHGAARPLWLCDVAVALETRPTDFDWDLCLGGDQRRAEWVVTALGLAHHLLGARLDDTPVAERAARLPRWLVPTVLRSWASGYSPNARLAGYWQQMFKVVRELPHYWRNPIEATIEVNAPFNEWPRLPLQVAALARRTARYLIRLPRW